MTTNSPNPVDGDVQALIEHIKAVIDEYESFGAGGMDEQVYRIALAALTAPGRKVFTCSGCGCESFDAPAEDDCHCFSEGRKWLESLVYTTPPAQLLRPVELTEWIKNANSVQYKQGRMMFLRYYASRATR